MVSDEIGDEIIFDDDDNVEMEVEKEKEGRKVAEGEVVKGKEELARQEKEQNKKLEESLQEREREKQVRICY